METCAGSEQPQQVRMHPGGVYQEVKRNLQFRNKIEFCMKDCILDHVTTNAVC